jgi:hypothetical protein
MESRSALDIFVVACPFRKTGFHFSGTCSKAAAAINPERGEQKGLVTWCIAESLDAFAIEASV